MKFYFLIVLLILMLLFFPAKQELPSTQPIIDFPQETPFPFEYWQNQNNEIFALLQFEDNDIDRCIPVVYNESEPLKYTAK